MGMRNAMGYATARAARLVDNVVDLAGVLAAAGCFLGALRIAGWLERRYRARYGGESPTVFDVMRLHGWRP